MSYASSATAKPLQSSGRAVCGVLRSAHAHAHGLGQRPVRRGGLHCLRLHVATDERLAAAVDGGGRRRHQLGQVLVAWLLQRERRA